MNLKSPKLPDEIRHLPTYLTLRSKVLLPPSVSILNRRLQIWQIYRKIKVTDYSNEIYKLVIGRKK